MGKKKATRDRKMDPKLMTLRQAADAVFCSIDYLRKEIKKYEKSGTDGLEHVRLGSAIRVRPESLEKFINAKTVPSAKEQG